MVKSYTAFKVLGSPSDVHALGVKVNSFGGSLQDCYQSPRGLAGCAAVVPSQYAGKIYSMSRVLGMKSTPLNSMQRYKPLFSM
jgi:hypothetical protein